MKLSELSKSELCELLKILLRLPDFMIRDRVHRFLLARWDKRFNELMEESEKYPDLEQIGEWEKVQEKIDRHQRKMEYYCELDELKE